MKVERRAEINYVAREYEQGIRHIFQATSKGITWFVTRKEYAKEIGWVKMGSEVIPNHVMKIDWVMDQIGVGETNTRLKKFLADSGLASFGDMMSNPEFSDKYRSWLDSQVEEADKLPQKVKYLPNGVAV